MLTQSFYCRRHSDPDREIGLAVSQIIMPTGNTDANGFPELMVLISVLFNNSRAQSPTLVPSTDLEWVSVPGITNYRSEAVLRDLLIEEGVTNYLDEEDEEEEEEEGEELEEDEEEEEEGEEA